MRELSKSIVLAVLFLVFTGVQHAGFMAIFFAPFIVIGVVRRGFLMWKKRDQRRLHGAIVGIWLLTVAVVSGAHAYYFHAMRSSAESVRESVVRYKQVNGVYPPTVAELGKKGIHGVFYGAENGIPHLFHVATFVPYATYHFDFESGRWVFAD